MTRATRSSTTQHEKDKQQVETPGPKKGTGSKKRKRTSIAEHSEQPANKLVRTHDIVKEEGTPDPTDEYLEEAPTSSKVELPSSGDLPLLSEDAEQILEVLEMVDTQGLLDRIFPLPTEHSSNAESLAGPSTGTQSYSFRALLKSPSHYPLRVLRSAVKHLLPISSHPRSRPSAPAAEQLRFCQLALSLLDQASSHQAPVPLDVSSLISSPRPQDEVDGTTPFVPNAPRSMPKFALVQRLPTGDWWSSVNSAYSTLTEGKDLKDLPTSYAELVSILPSASTSDPPADSLTLGNYIKKRAYKPQNIPQQRGMPCGSFLDYGPYTTFAPTFEQNGVEVGRERLSEVVWFKEQDKRQKARIRTYRERLAAGAGQNRSQGVETEVAEVEMTSTKQKERMKDEDLDALEGLLTAEQIDAVKLAAKSLELEGSVSELLDRNAQALIRLEALQLARLGSSGDEGKDVQVDSEEWETAQGILESLTLLASLRPRTSSDPDSAPLIPPPNVLRKLHRTLPVGAMQGWYGTLPETRPSACSDDTTVRVRTDIPVPTPAVPPPAPSVAAAPSTPVPIKQAAPTYNNYSYSATYATPYRGAYGTNYYPNYAASAAQSTSTNHYPNHQYTVSGQQPYSAYSSWYNYQPQQAGTSAAASSGTSTPVAKPTAAGTPSGYAGYFSNTPQPGTQRAVANTVLTPGASAVRTWSNGAAYVAAPTIPPHMRSATSSSGNTSSPAAAATTGAGGYYIGYQQQQQQPTAAAQSS